MDEIHILDLVRRRRRRQRARERLQFLRYNRNRLRDIRDTSDPFAVSNDVFKGLYRLKKEMTRDLIEELRPHMVHARRSTAIPVELKVLCALHFYGQGSYQKSAGSDNNLGLSQSSVSNVLEEVTEALNSPAILAKWIQFPLTMEARKRLINKNYLAHHIPGVIGFVDGTHVAIKAPQEEENLYLNRKYFHSINVMIVCDSELNIINCFGRFGGSNHDSYVWNESTVKAIMTRLWESGEQCWLLGDSGYPHQPWLHTPILNAPEGSPEAHYTNLHVQARSAVERCIGLLKGRFRCLLRHRVLEYTPLKAGRIVNACAVLHNMCLRGDVTKDDETLYECGEEHLPVDELPAEQAPRMALLHEARVVRQRLINRLQQ